MRIAAGNAQHMGDRQDQQDSFGFSDPGNEAFVAHGGILGVVADGMGGLSHGSEASHAAVQAFLRAYESKPPAESVPDALARALAAANQEVVALSDRVGSRNGTGTTLVAAVVHNESLHWISAGDSRVYLCHGNSLIRVTSDHVYARQLNEDVVKGKISRAEAESNAERAALTSFLGDLKEVDRNLRPFALCKGDHVVLCSDGLYRALSDSEIIEAFRRDPQTACDTLVEQAIAKGRKHQDNITVIALSNEAVPVQSRPALNRVLAIIAGLLLLAAIAGGIYAWRWRTRSTAPAAAGTSGVNPGGSSAGSTTPASQPRAGSQSGASGTPASGSIKNNAGGQSKQENLPTTPAGGGHGGHSQPAQKQTGKGAPANGTTGRGTTASPSTSPPQDSQPTPAVQPPPPSAAQTQGTESTPSNSAASPNGAKPSSPANAPDTPEKKPGDAAPGTDSPPSALNPPRPETAGD